jgi:hypothetical protein
MTLYQARMRQGSDSNRVTLHYTTTYVEGRSHKAERLANVLTGLIGGAHPYAG